MPTRADSQIKRETRNPPGVDALVSAWQQTGDRKALSRLVQTYEKLIRATSQRWSKAWHLEADDCYQLSSMGFCRAVSRYDPTVIPLRPYALQTMRALIQRSRSERGPIRYPAGAFADAMLVTRVLADLEKKGGRVTLKSIVR